MRQQLVGVIGLFLLSFCVLVVIWQVFVGTKKYLAAPVANKIYAEEVELPVITICHHKHSLRAQSQFGLDWDDFKAGKLLPDNADNVSAEDVFEEAFYYLLDITGIVFTF